MTSESNFSISSVSSGASESDSDDELEAAEELELLDELEEELPELLAADFLSRSGLPVPTWCFVALHEHSRLPCPDFTVDRDQQQSRPRCMALQSLDWHLSGCCSQLYSLTESRTRPRFPEYVFWVFLLGM